MPLLVFLITLTFNINANSAPIIPLENNHVYYLVEEVDYLLDPNNSLKYEDVKSSSLWKGIESDIINFSFIKNTLWLRFHLLAQDNGKWILKIPFPLLDHISVFSTLNEKTLPTITTGDAHVFSTRPIDHPHFLFPYELTKGDDLEIIIKIRTTGATEVPIYFVSESESELDYEIMTFLHGWMNGILVVMIFYNFVIYILTKDSIYLSYSFAVISYLLMFASYNGTGFQYLWHDYPEINSPIFAFINGFYQLSNCIFIIMFLKIFTNKSWLIHIFKPLLYAFIVLLPLSFIAPYQVIMLIYIILSIVLNISGLIAGIYYSLKGDKSAIYFTLAWCLLIISIMIGNLRGLGLLPVNWITLYSYQIGVFIEVVVLSIALAQRIENDRIISILNLKKYEDLYRTTLSGQFTLDKNGVINSANPSFCKMLGYNNEKEVIALSEKENGRYFHIDKNLPDKLFSMLKKVQKTFDMELKLKTKNGQEKWFSSSIQSIKDNKGNIIAYEGSLIDIHERKENEDINKRSLQERMMTMEHLIVGICHEINTPVGVSNTAIYHLKENLDTLNDSFTSGTLTKSAFTKEIKYEKETAELVEENLEKINDLIRKFKEISVLQKGYKYEAGSLCEIIENQLPLLHKKIHPDNIKIECKKPLDFIGYPKALIDIINQIITNCIQHGYENKDEVNIFIKASSSKDRIELKIGDDGKGIKIENIRNIFNPFYTTEKENNGSIGLGLYQVYNIISQLMDGTIEVKNTNPGTEFTINFPIHVKQKNEKIKNTIDSF
ncbi:hypothetical protein NBRC116188_14970 [Oceaniserpentilla sp. 4NH20-0058]|uniref:7TM diverse intracellular signaling domain-containing protein n=1 Tax=Oceaniserpentilla sp. 4NH20-0058 TaxID=3127660 RepID=UPI0031071B1C